MAGGSDTRPLKVLVPIEDIEWFEEHYPSRGAKSWFVRAALRRFRQLHEETPPELVEQAVRNIDLT